MDKGSEPAGGGPRKARKFPVKLLTGYWPLGGGEKMPAGSEAELPADEAKDLVKRGLAARNDPL
ncbi:hypothetical protein MesoLjLc_22050 [Mesorhizobium sp. L-8-10]|uniref:hypothetical protein n=1 Tax=Mesorhizobium sp. L-8-10 TaxID=2744523 RepID=UPI00192745A6|nr:hypothetical protein [Mesorhizobium sp. L-8-10]BCH22460.1 hypothetical protein MesoLjLb_22450 [Mesorhizobium sp. L-8-3]BCH30275.1 hypothetical protein MesoLjLc_22050 [Mesorhizobium sp. L-8-10]